MADGTFNLSNAGVEISKIRLIGDLRRPELAGIGSYRTTPNLPYDRNHPFIFSEGYGSADNRGKDPLTPPASITDSYKTVGGKDDIEARIGTSSPGSLSKNTYWAGGNQYDNVI